MKNTLKKFVAVTCAIIVLLSCSTTAFAQNLNTATQEYFKETISINRSVKCTSSSYSQI